MLFKNGEQRKIYLKAGEYRLPVDAKRTDDVLALRFRYNKHLLAEIKAMQTAKWNPDLKIWTIKYCSRNIFNLRYLMGENPYEHYDKKYELIESKRPLYEHQIEMASFALARRRCILACEMGTGKTLSAIEVMENVAERYDLLDQQIWYVAPRSGIRAVNLELEKWDSGIQPYMMTYQGLVKRLKNWDDGEEAPTLVIFDESSKVKNPNAQRSQAALHLANAMREEWSEDAHIILMSGSPAPKSPVDWWMQCEIACPGFLKEGNVHKLKHRLCIIEQRESITGGMYPHIVSWRNNTDICDNCGIHRNEHDDVECGFKESKNEVSFLYERMKGLVYVKFKKDCLDLPEKIYETITVTPDVSTLRSAQLIRKTAPRAVQALTLLRELSDGFQYKEIKVGEEKCSYCQGTGKAVKRVLKPEYLDSKNPLNPSDVRADMFEKKVLPCDYCKDGISPVIKRGMEEVKCPKDDVLIDELDLAEEVGRLVVWGGFTGTVDRIEKIAHQQGWATLRVDGRGYVGTSATGDVLDDSDLLKAMDNSHKDRDELLEKYPKVCFVGNPEAGGMGLTLTAAQVELFFSNSFKGEARMQAEDRCHRPGMDTNKGLIIKDIIHLPTDKLVIKNVQKKRSLQALTLGDIEESFNEVQD